jgi:hypothetical protein
MKKKIEELKENFEELGLRTSEILDFKVLAKSLDNEGFLNDDFELVDLDKFRAIQNALLNSGLFETACKNFRNLAEEIDLIPNRLNNNIEKILLGIEQLHLIIEKDLLEKQKKKETPKEEPQTPKQEEIPKAEISKPEEIVPDEDIAESEEEQDLDQTEKEAENDALYDEAEEDEV